MFGRRARSALALVLTALAGAGACLGQQRPVAFVGARLLPIAGAEVPSGALVVHRGKIVAVGAEATIPADAERREASGLTIMPGLVDTHSHIGQVEGADRSGPIQPDARALDSIDARDPRIRKARAGGVTVANIMPGSGHLLSGQTLYVKLRPATTIDELLIPRDDGSPAGGVKMANGTNSRRDPPFPGTRAKSAALVREQFVKAMEYREKLRRAAGDPAKAPDRDLRMETLVEVLEGRKIVHFHTHRHDDIATVLRLAREFGFRVVLQHVSDARFVAGEIAVAGVVGSSLILIDAPGGKIEAKDNDFANGAALERVGATVGFHTDDGITDSRLFRRQAALAVRAGMSREKALEGLTLAGAKMLDLQDRIGSLEPGKDADFILLDGDPLSVYTHVVETWIDGVKVFDRSDPQDRLYAVGGRGTGAGSNIHVHEWADEERE